MIPNLTLKCYKNEHSFVICHWAWSSIVMQNVAAMRSDVLEKMTFEVAIFGSFPDISELKLSLPFWIMEGRPSSVRLFTFSTSSPEPLDDFLMKLKLGMDEVLKVPYKCCCFSARSVQGRIQGGAKIGHGDPLLQETSSSDRKATATNRMHSSDLETCGKKCCYFWFHSEVKFLTRFWRLFGLSQICLI